MSRIRYAVERRAASRTSPLAGLRKGIGALAPLPLSGDLRRHRAPAKLTLVLILILSCAVLPGRAGAPSGTVGEFIRPARILDLGRGYSSLSSIAFSRDSRTVAVGLGPYNAIRLWDVRTGQVLLTIKETDWVTSVAMSPIAPLLASATFDGVKIWDLEERRLVVAWSGVSVSQVAFSPDGKLIAAGGDGGQIRLWDVRTHALVHVLGEFKQYASVGVTFSPDGRYIATNEPGSFSPRINIWDVASGKLLRQLPSTGSGSEYLAYSSTGRAIAGNGSVRQADVTLLFVALWDPRTTLEPDYLPVEHPVGPLAFSPDGRMLAVAQHLHKNSDGAVRLWDVQHRRWTYTFYAGKDETAFSALTYSPDGRTLAAGFMSLFLWDVPDAGPGGKR